MAELERFRKGDRVVQVQIDEREVVDWSSIAWVEHTVRKTPAPSPDTIRRYKINAGEKGTIIGPGPSGETWYVDFDGGRPCYVSDEYIDRAPLELPPMKLNSRRKLSLC